MAGTRVRYTGPIDEIAVPLERGEITARRLEPIDLADRLPVNDARKLAAALNRQETWEYVPDEDKAEGADASGKDGEA